MTDATDLDIESAFSKAIDVARLRKEHADRLAVCPLAEELQSGRWHSVWCRAGEGPLTPPPWLLEEAAQ